MQGESFITPGWPAPSRVKALMTTRCGGVSATPWDSLNLGDHVGDVSSAVVENRQRLLTLARLPAPPTWLQQVHGTEIIKLPLRDTETQGDGCYTADTAVVCAVMTADCLPLLITDRSGGVVAAVHAGWRGLLDGVIEATIDRLPVPGAELLVWLGPAIGPAHFEVGADVYTLFGQEDPASAAAFTPSTRAGHWMADIYQLACQRLQRAGVQAIYGGGLCTYSDPQRFFSYRRDGVTGRMAALIWLSH